PLLSFPTRRSSDLSGRSPTSSTAGGIAPSPSPGCGRAGAPPPRPTPSTPAPSSRPPPARRWRESTTGCRSCSPGNAPGRGLPPVPWRHPSGRLCCVPMRRTTSRRTPSPPWSIPPPTSRRPACFPPRRSPQPSPSSPERFARHTSIEPPVNLLLLQPEDFREDGTVHLTGCRAAHAREVLRAQEGSSLRVGRRDGQVGRATVLANDVDGLHLDICLESPPPPRAGVTLILAIPRPKALKKVLPAVASLGVDRVFLLNAARVEKSYLDSHVLRPESVETLFGLGLEQARDTVAPELHLRPRFRPFVEDELPGRLDGVPLRL